MMFICRAVMTHASVDPEDRAKLGITDTLVCSHYHYDKYLMYITMSHRLNNYLCFKGDFNILFNCYK